MNSWRVVQRDILLLTDTDAAKALRGVHVRTVTQASRLTPYHRLPSLFTNRSRLEACKTVHVRRLSYDAGGERRVRPEANPRF
jgi:hypothetical protein